MIFVPICICWTSIFPPFSLGGIVLRQSLAWLPPSPHTDAGSAPPVEGPSTTPPAAAKSASRAFHAATSGKPGKTPIEPGKASKGTVIPGIPSETAPILVSFQLTI